MLTTEERRLLRLEESAPPNIWIPDRHRRSPEAYMRDLGDFHLSVRKDAPTGQYRAEVTERRSPHPRVWWGKDFESRFAACNAAVRKAQEQIDPSLPRTSRILTPNQKAVDETEPAYVIGQVALGQGLGQELNGWISTLTAGAPTIYDKAMDSVYNATRVGGGLHRQFDGGHTIIGAFRSARDAAPNNSILQELVGASKGLLKDSVTPRGLPFVTWDQEIYHRAAQAVERYLLISKDTFYKMTSWNVPQVLSGGLGLVDLAAAWKSGSVRRLSETAGRLIASAATFRNGVLLLIALPALGKAIYEAKKQNRLNELVPGLLKAGLSVVLATAILSLASSVAVAVVGPGIAANLCAIAATYGIAKVVEIAMRHPLGEAAVNAAKTVARGTARVASTAWQHTKQAAISFWEWLKGVASWMFGNPQLQPARSW